MDDQFYIGTRKGLFRARRANDGKWLIEGPEFRSSPVTMVLRDSRDGAEYAALNLGHFGPHLWRKMPGAAWEEIETPAFPREAGGTAVSMIWALEPGGPDQEGRLWLGTLPGGLFRSDDRGAHWMLVQTLWDHPERAKWAGGGYDDPGIHSICVRPDDPEAIAVGVSVGGVWHTRDGGASWALSGPGMVASYMPGPMQNDPAVQDPHRLVQCPANPDVLWVQHHCGIFRSTDWGESWHRIQVGVTSDFGFAVVVHPRDPEQAWFAPAVSDEIRIPVDDALVVSHTGNGGGQFRLLDTGLPGPGAYDLVYRHALEINSSGTCLAMGSTTGNLWVSDDAGESWTCISQHLPPIYCIRF